MIVQMSRRTDFVFWRFALILAPILFVAEAWPCSAAENYLVQDESGVVKEAAAPAESGEGEIFPERISQALVRAGANRGAIEDFLESYDEGSEEVEAARFLIANMPTVDLVSLSVDELRENVTYAFKARHELPWVHDLPFSLFLHYVLPHRVTQESYEPWRKELFDSIAPVLRGCKNMTEAAVAVNRWCGQRVTFKQTEFRDQNVMSTLRSGIGRCEEEMIVTIDAMRSVGIPARACSAPWWVVNDNNHAWVEVWTDGEWHYMGGCEPAGQLDQGWFSGPVQRAGTVISQMYGSPDEYPTGEVVCRDMDNMALINSTAVYAMTGEVEIAVLDQNGSPVADCPVSAAVFNYGGLRPLNIQRTDENGRTTFVMGLGEYFFAAGKEESGRAHEVIQTKPGKHLVTMFHLKKGDAPDGAFWMRYPTVAEARRWAAKRNWRTEVGGAEISYRPELPANVERDLYSTEKDAGLESIIEGSSDPEAWRGILNDARGNWRAIAAGLKALSTDEALLDAALEFMKRTSKVDRLEITPATIEDHVVNAAKSWQPGLDAGMYYESILNGRIGYEHLTPWRKRMVDEIGGACMRENAEDTVAALCDWIVRNITDEEGSRLGPTMNPGQVLESRHASHRGKVGFAVGALRALGIPAKTNGVGDRAEFYDGTNWLIFEPGDASSIRLVGETAGEADKGSESSSGDGVEAPGRVDVHLARDGKPLGGGFHGLDIAKFTNGSWAPLRDYSYEVDEDGTHHITVPAGEYLVTGGIRNANGDPYVHAKLIQLEAGKDVEISWDLTLPKDSGMFRFPIARKLEKFPEGVVVHDRTSGDEINLTEMVEKAPTLIYFFRKDDEPSIRMLDLINKALPTLREVGVKAIGIALPAAEDATIEAFLARHPSEMQIVEGSVEVGEAFGLEATQPLGLFRPMPSVLLMQRGGGVILWVEDLNLDLDRLLADASRQVN